MIAENMHAREHDDSNKVQIMDAIVDFRKYSNPVYKADMRLCTKSGQQHLRRTTSSWFILIIWKNREEECVTLDHLKKSLPLETAEFVVSRRIHNETAFK